MKRRSELRCLACVLLLVAAGCASSPAPAGSASGSEEQLRFGVEMARRGLWNEALFRFEQARRERPNDAELLNDLAVALEAVGRFDEARESYEAAARLAPSNRQIRANQSRFLEFYQNFRPAAGKDAPAPGASGARP